MFHAGRLADPDLGRRSLSSTLAFSLGLLPPFSLVLSRFLIFFLSFLLVAGFQNQPVAEAPLLLGKNQGYKSNSFHFVSVYQAFFINQHADELQVYFFFNWT